MVKARSLSKSRYPERPTAVKLFFTLKLSVKLTLSLEVFFPWCVGSGRTGNEDKMRSLIRDPLHKPGIAEDHTTSQYAWIKNEPIISKNCKKMVGLKTWCWIEEEKFSLRIHDHKPPLMWVWSLDSHHLTHSGFSLNTSHPGNLLGSWHNQSICL